MADQPKKLVRLDPESDACFDEMCAIINEEITVRAAIEEKKDADAAWIKRVSELAADALLHRFVVRRRMPDNPLYRFED